MKLHPAKKDAFIVIRIQSENFTIEKCWSVLLIGEDDSIRFYYENQGKGGPAARVNAETGRSNEPHQR
jgi:hypothetical protein